MQDSQQQAESLALDADAVQIAAASSSIRLVIDTQVALDLWLFDQASVRPWAERLRSGDVTVVRSKVTRQEFIQVAGLDKFAGYRAQRGLTVQQIIADFDNLKVLEIEPASAEWRCVDPDDQHFLDLAAAVRPCLLWTRDRHLLRHRRAAGRVGVVIGAPERVGLGAVNLL